MALKTRRAVAAWAARSLEDRRPGWPGMLPGGSCADGLAAAMRAVGIRQKNRDPAMHIVHRGIPTGLDALALQRARHFLHFEQLELVAFLDVVEVLQGQAAFEAGLDFLDVILEALQR